MVSQFSCLYCQNQLFQFQKASTPSQGWSLGRGNGGISWNFTKNHYFSENSENGGNSLKLRKNQKKRTFPPQAHNLAYAPRFLGTF